MPRGLPRSYIAQARRELGSGASVSSVFKRAWKLYKGSKVYSALSGRRKTSRKTKKRSVRSLSRRKKRYSRKMTIPLAAVGGALAGVIITPPGASTNPLDLLMKGKWDLGLKHMLWNYTGYNPYNDTWNIMDARGLHVALAGILAHKVASLLGINRVLGRSRVPLIRI